MSIDQRVEAKRKRDTLAEEASAREYHRRHHTGKVLGKVLLYPDQRG
jgi:hypothetical protein